MKAIPFIAQPHEVRGILNGSLTEIWRTTMQPEMDTTELYLHVSDADREQADAIQLGIEKLARKLERIKRAWWGPLLWFEAIKLHRRIEALIAYRHHLLWMAQVNRPEVTTWRKK